MTNARQTTHEARLQKRLRRDFPIYEFVGLEVHSARDEIYRCYVPYRESNLNHIKTIHAGIQWSASEVVGGVVVMSLFEGIPFFAVVKDVSIEFKRPARSGITVETSFDTVTAERVKADFEREGEATFGLHAVVLDEDRVEVAVADANYLVRKPRV